MKQKLLDLLAKIKPYALSAYSTSPLLCGLVMGYVFQPEIHLVLSASMTLIKGIVTHV